MKKTGASIIACALISIVLSGCTFISPGVCSSREHQEKCSIDWAQPSKPGAEQAETSFESVVERIIAEKIVEESVSTRDIKEKTQVKTIILSGGAAKGAYGAGFLNGLKEAVGGDELNYDLVAGVSTGAVQSTFVFLGPDYYDKLARIYTAEPWGKLFVKKSIHHFLFCPRSVYSIEGVEKVFENYLEDDLIDEVAEISNKSAGTRGLFVGTVGLDDGQFKIWNMVEIAKKAHASKDKEYYDLYRKIILASSSMPLAFPSIEFTCEELKGLFEYRDYQTHVGLHVDGGVRHMAFIPQLDEVLKLYQAPTGQSINLVEKVFTESFGAGNYFDAEAAIKKVRVHGSVDFILNNSIHPATAVTQPHLLDVGERTISSLFKQFIESDVIRAYFTARVGGGDFRITHVKEEDLPFGKDDPFYPGIQQDMQKLYKTGFDRGKISMWDDITTDEDFRNIWRIIDGICRTPSGRLC